MKIAFLFSGSSRSFILPQVYLTIKTNLINSLCNITFLCYKEVFIRISTIDNILDGLNSNGILSNNDGSILIDVKKALNELNCYYEIVDLNSLDDIKLQESFHGLRHKIYRLYDKRRYSMYINRWAVFDLMRRHEISFGYKFDYIVHARLDAAWFAPVPPFPLWYRKESDYSKVVLHDRWAEFVSDTFAIMPRSYADDYYSMDVLVKPGIMCLGGPNFDPRSLNTKSFLDGGFSFEEQEIILNELCERSIVPKKTITRKDGSVYVFKGAVLEDHWETSVKTKVYFTGYSEQILGRKFEYMGLSIKNDSFLYKPLPMSIVRYQKVRSRSVQPQCTYLELQHIYGHTRTTLYHSSALDIGCINMLISTYEYSDECELKTQSMLESYQKILSNPNKALLDQKHECEVMKPEEKSYKQLSYKNYLPFLLKIKVKIEKQNQIEEVERCLTVNETSLEVLLSPCIRKYKDKHNRKYIYSKQQLFIFNPLLSGEQRIMYYSPKRLVNLCLSYISQNVTFAQFIGCRSGVTSLRPYNEPLFYKKGVTIIQSIRVRMKNSKNYLIVSNNEVEDNQIWLDHDEYPVRLMITKNQVDSKSLNLMSLTPNEYRLHQKYDRQFCLSPSTTTSSSPTTSIVSNNILNWNLCITVTKTVNDKVRTKRNENIIFIAERAAGVW